MEQIDYFFFFSTLGTSLNICSFIEIVTKISIRKAELGLFQMTVLKVVRTKSMKTDVGFHKTLSNCVEVIVAAGFLGVDLHVNSWRMVTLIITSFNEEKLMKFMMLISGTIA